MKTLVCFLLMIPAVALADENLFKNSGMETVSGWKGDRSFVELDGNRVLEVKANPRKITSFSQDAPTRGLTDVVLRFRYMSTNYEGRGLQLRGERFDRTYTYYELDVEADGQWHDYEWNFPEIDGARRINFIFRILEGKGEICFDDITLMPR